MVELCTWTMHSVPLDKSTVWAMAKYCLSDVRNYWCKQKVGFGWPGIPRFRFVDDQVLRAMAEVTGTSTGRQHQPVKHTITLLWAGEKAQQRPSQAGRLLAPKGWPRETTQIQFKHFCRKSNSMAVDQEGQFVDNTSYLGTSWGLIVPGRVTRARVTEFERHETPDYITDDVPKMHRKLCVQTE